MLRLNASTRKIDTIFIVCLFMLFSFTACLLVLLGAAQYRSTVDSMNQNYEVRTASSYLTEKIRQYDTAGGVAVTNFHGTTALSLKNSVGDKSYTTYIYYYNGALRELLIGSDASYSLDAGQSVIALDSFDAELADTNLIHIVYTDTQGVTHDLYLALHAAA